MMLGLIISPNAIMKGIIALILIRLIGCLPLTVAQLLGAFIGRCLTWIPNDLKRVSTINIRLCYPKLTARKQRQLVNKSLIQTTITIAEMPALWLHNPKRLIKKAIIPSEGFKQVKTAQDLGNNIIFLAPHLGCWEQQEPTGIGA